MPALERPVKNKTRTTDVKEIMLDWIRQGKFPPGSLLPSVPELVARLGVSRTVVREALQSLVGMNFVEMRPGLGSYVKSVPPDLIVNADVMAALIDIDTLIKVAIARKAIEGSVARLAAAQAEDEDFEEMELILSKIRRLARKNQPMHSLTPEFHVAVAKATHNDVLVGVVSSFNSLMVAAGEVIECEKVGYEYRMGEYESHRELLEVLLTRDSARAQIAMEDHIQITIDVLQRVQLQSGR
ncbi:MAG: FadR family transcriptional regulator [Acidobacteriaceae bacterium]|nr:FadR family transcriptional regulator [Acidobacteriaceae bacterium]